MDEPNAELMARYGTQDIYLSNLEKRAELPLLLKLLGPVGTAALMSHGANNQERQVQEAQILNEMLRAVEARRQKGVVEGLSGKSPALSTSGQAAQQLNQMREYRRMMSLMDKRASVVDMDKEAFGALAAGAGTLLGNEGTQLRGLAPKMKGATKAVGPKVPGTGATQGIAQASQATKSKKPLVGLKGKLLMGGAAAGAGMAGYKGLGAAKDYMMQPTYQSNAWGGSGTLKGGVNQYGYNNPY